MVNVARVEFELVASAKLSRGGKAYGEQGEMESSAVHFPVTKEPVQRSSVLGQYQGNIDILESYRGM